MGAPMKSEAIESEQPKTIEDRFPVGSRWRTRGTHGLGRGIECVLRKRGINMAWFHTLDGQLLCAPMYINIDFVLERLDDHPAPPTVAEPAAPAKPAPMCEAPGWVGRAHAVDATEYGTCRVCGASAGDRRAARRRVFDADVYTEKGPCGWKRGNERVWRAAVSGIGEAFAPTREDAIEALWTRLEAER